MNSTSGSIWYSLGLDNNGLRKDAQDAKNVIRSIGDTITAESNRIDSAYTKIRNGLTFVLSTSAAAVFVSNVAKVRGEFQQLEIAMTTMLGSKSKADKMMSEMVDFASKTPFELKDVGNGARQLLAIGESAENIIPTLKALGDVSAGVSVPLERLMLNYGQVKSLGVLRGTELRDFMVAGVPILSELAKNLEKTEQEIKDLVSAGKIGFADVEKAFKTMSSEGGDFFDLMENQSKSITGQMSNLRDNIDTMFNEIGKSSEGIFSGAIEGANYLVENYKTIGQTISELIVAYGTYRAALLTTIAAERATVNVKNANQAEEKFKLLSAIQRENIEKQKLLPTSKAYQITVEKEIQANLEARRIAVEKSRAELFAVKESIATKKIEMTEIQKTISVRQAELIVAQQSGDAKKIKIAQDKLATAVAEKENIIIERRNAISRLTIARTNLESASTAQNTLQTSLNTATQTANARASGALAIAKMHLRNITTQLNATIMANPYALVLAGVVALGYAIYKVATYSTELEKAQKKLNDTFREVESEGRKEELMFIDLMSQLKANEEGTEQFKKVRDQLFGKFGDYLAGINKETASLRDLEQAYDGVIEKIRQKYREDAMYKAIEESAKAYIDVEQEQLQNIENELRKKFGDKVGGYYFYQIKPKIIAGEELSKEFQSIIKDFDKTILYGGGQFGGGGSYTSNVLKESLRKIQEAKDISNQIKKEAQELANSVFINGDREFKGNVFERFKPSEHTGTSVSEIRAKIKSVKNELLKLRKTQSFESDEAFKAHLQDIETKEKELSELNKQIESLTGEKPTQSRKKSEKTFDSEAFDIEQQRKAYDTKLAQQRQYVEAMKEGNQKELALIELHHKEKLESIDRILQDELKKLEKQYKDGDINSRQYDLSKRIAFEAYQQGHSANNQVREQQEKKLLENLVKEYQTYEEKKSELTKEYEEKRALLVSKNINGKYDKNIAELDKKYKKDFNELKIKQLEESGVFQRLFSDLSLYSNQQLNEMVEESRKAIEEVKKELDLTDTKSLEYLKNLNDQFDKLKKAAQGSFANNIKNLISGLKTLTKQDATEPEKVDAGNKISIGIDELQNVSEEMRRIFEKLGDDLESSLLKSFAKITSGIQQGLQGLNVAFQVQTGKMSKGEGWANAIGAGVNFLTNMIGDISANNRAIRRQERQDALEKIQMQEDYNLSLAEELRLRTELSSSGMTDQYVNRIKDGLKSLHYATEQQQNKIRELMQKGQVKNGSRNQTDWEAVGQYALAGVGAGAAIGSVIPVIGTAIGAVVGGIVGAIGGLFKKKRKQEWKGILAEFPELITKGENGLLNVNKALLDSMKKNNQLNDETRQIVENIEEWNTQIEKSKQQIEEVIDDIVSGLGSNIRNNLVDSFKAGEDAIESLRKTFSALVEDMTSKILMDILFEPAFKKFKDEAAKSYHIDGDQTIVDDIGDLYKSILKQRELFNEGLRQAREEGKQYDLNLFEQKAKESQGQIKGVQSITQDQASEFIARLTLDNELSRVRNISLSEITELAKSANYSFKEMQSTMARQLQHLAGIEANTYVLHQMSKDMAGMKNTLSDIQLKGLKMK